MAVLAVSIVLFFWKLVFTRQFEWIWGPDLAQQVLPWFEIQARQFNAGHWPLWDPSFWCGQPLIGQMQPGAAFPLNWILFSLPLDLVVVDQLNVKSVRPFKTKDDAPVGAHGNRP